MSKKIGLDIEFDKLGELAPLGFGLGLHIRFASPLISLYTWSAEWQDRYTKQVYVLRDPMIAWAFAKQGACRWSECPLPDPFGVVDEAASYGLTYGATISCGPLSSRTIAGIARDDREFQDEELERVRVLVQDLHHRTEPPERFTKAQRVCRCVPTSATARTSLRARAHKRYTVYSAHATSCLLRSNRDGIKF